jgi:hypothetical protein
MIHTVSQKTKYRLSLITGGCLLLISGGCQRGNPDAVQSFEIPHLLYRSFYQVFVETPAGNLQTLSFNAKTGMIDTLTEEEGGLRNDYLPYPVNSCFFPLIRDDSLLKIPAWLVAGRMTAGDTLAVRMLGMVEYREQGISRQECLVIPVDPALQTIRSERFRDFIIQYDAVKFMFETWLKNRHGIGQVSQLSWKDEVEAANYLETLTRERDR